MLKNKLILIVLLIFVFSLKGTALNSSYKNSLEEINIKKASGGSYSINLLFNKNYTEPLSIQKKTPNTYSIILPETQISNSNVKIVYIDGKEKIKLKVNEYPYLDQSINNGYVKVTATTLGNISLNVASGIKSIEKKNKVEVKNTEVVKREKSQVQETDKSLTETKSTETAPITSGEDLQIDAGSTMHETNAIPESPPVTKNKLSPDYVQILSIISLIIFILLVLLRQLYKKFKAYQLTEQSKPDYKKRIEGGYETDEQIEHSQSEPVVSQTTKAKSQFEQEIERQNQQNIQQDCYQETSANDLFTSDILVAKKAENEDDYEDEDFDYDFDFDEEIVEQLTPKLLSSAPIDTNKGFYLIQYDGETALVGYVGDEIFVINKFEKIYNPNLQTRLHERKMDRANYLVRIDNYKALIEVCKTSMNVLIEF